LAELEIVAITDGTDKEEVVQAVETLLDNFSGLTHLCIDANEDRMMTCSAFPDMVQLSVTLE
jgi:hypothetical protein